jgi:hypothetical protein
VNLVSRKILRSKKSRVQPGMKEAQEPNQWYSWREDARPDILSLTTRRDPVYLPIR